MKGTTTLWAAAIVVLVTMTPRTALPCGAFFTEVVGSDAAMSAQRALMVVGTDTVEIHFQVAADTDATGFAWVLPVPEVQAEDIALGDEEVFEQLDELTAPRVELFVDSGGDDGGGGCFCGADDAKDGGALGGGQYGGVEHFGGGQIGNYQYNILGGDSAADMIQWLHDNSYVVPNGADAVLQPYADAGLRFVWAPIVLQPTGSAVGQRLDPIAITIPASADGSIGYPLGLSRLSAAAVTPVVLWVAAKTRYQVGLVDSYELGDVAQRMRQIFDDTGDADYDTTVDALTADAGGTAAVTEYAWSLGDEAFLVPPLADLLADATFMTRFYLRVPAASLTDLMLTSTGSTAEVDHRQMAAADPGRTPVPVAFASFGITLLLWLGWRCRRLRAR